MIGVLEGNGMGTIRVMVPQLMAENDMNISDLANALGLSWPTARKLARGKLPRLTAEQFAKMCDIFKAQPGDILVYLPDEDGGQT